MEEAKEIATIDNEKVKQILNKTIFILEFIISAIFMIFYYKFICKRAYEGYNSVKCLIICGITGIGIVATIIYMIIKNKDRIEKIFVAIAIPIGMAYLIFLIPTYAPDENAHIYRSYEISEGILVTQSNEENLIKSNIPKFFVDNNHLTLKKYSDLNEALKQETDYNEKIEIDAPASSYFLTLYFPNSLMFSLGRVFNINGIIVLYLARMVNFIIFLICGYYTIKLMPFGKLLMMTYLLIPMVVHQAISLSADSITNTITLLFIAYTLNLYYRENINRKNKIIYILLAVLVAIHKTAYLPIVLISLIFLNRKDKPKKQQIKFIAIVIILSIIAGIAWMALSSTGEKAQDIYLITNNVNSSEQVKYIIQHPFNYLKVLVKTMIVNCGNYYLWFMGCSMGWMDIGIRRLYLHLYFILLICSPFLEKHDKELDIKSKIIFLLVAIMVFVLILTALYIGHSGVGTDIIKGVQGRYFIPIVILVLLCLCRKNKNINIKYIQMIYPVLIILLNMQVVRIIMNFFIT